MPPTLRKAARTSAPWGTLGEAPDIGNPTVASYAAGTNGAQKAPYIFYHKILQTTGSVTGHVVLMMQPDRVVDATTGWWKCTLKGDIGAARDLFVGTNCGLCGKICELRLWPKRTELRCCVVIAANANLLLRMS